MTRVSLVATAVGFVGGCCLCSVLGVFGKDCVLRRAWSSNPPPYRFEAEPGCGQGGCVRSGGLFEKTPVESVSMARLLGCNTPAPKPIVFPVRGAGFDDGPDLSTPAQAVRTALSLIGLDSSEQVATCFTGDVDVEAITQRFARHLGRPFSLIEVIEDDATAEVVWEATVHEEFVYQGRRRLLGERVTLNTQLVCVENQWKLLEFCEENEYDSPHERSLAD